MPSTEYSYITATNITFPRSFVQHKHVYYIHLTKVPSLFLFLPYNQSNVYHHMEIVHFPTAETTSGLNIFLYFRQGLLLSRMAVSLPVPCLSLLSIHDYKHMTLEFTFISTIVIVKNHAYFTFHHKKYVLLCRIYVRIFKYEIRDYPHLY